MPRIARDCSGASAVEFGLIAPVLVMTVMGALEYGLLIYTQAAMQHSARDSVRQLSIGQITDVTAPAYVCSKVTSWAKRHCTASVAHSNVADPKADVITVTVNVPASKASVVSFFTRATGDFTVTASAAMRREDVL